MTFVRALPFAFVALVVGCAPVVSRPGAQAGDMAVDNGGGGGSGNGGDDLGGTGGNGPTCPTGCSVGAASCDGNGVRSCAPDGNGCGVWSAPAACTSPMVCSGGQCGAACSSQCMLGATYCSGAGFRTCIGGAAGCNDWSPTVTATS